MGRKYKYWRQESMKSVSLGRGNRILAMEEGIGFFFKRGRACENK